MQNALRRLSNQAARWWRHAVFTSMFALSTGFLGYWLDPATLRVWVLFALFFLFVFGLWSGRRAGRTASDIMPLSTVASVCYFVLFSTGAALLGLVAGLTLRGSIAMIGSVTSLGETTWSSSPELLRGLLGLGAVLVATGLTLTILFYRHESTRRQRVKLEYRRRGRPDMWPVDRLQGLIDFASETIGHQDFTADPKRKEEEDRRELAERRNGLVLKVASMKPINPFALFNDMSRLEKELRDLGLLSHRTDQPMALSENEKLAEFVARAAQESVADQGTGPNLDYSQLLQEVTDLKVAVDALRRMAGDPEDPQPLQSAPRISLAEHLSSRLPESSLLHGTHQQTRNNLRIGKVGYFVAGVLALTLLPLVSTLLATTSSQFIDARWLDSVLAASAIVGAALLTLYAVLRESSITVLESTIEEAIESAGRITVLCSALVRTIEHPTALFASHGYVDNVHVGRYSATEVLATIDPWDTAVVEHLLDWMEQKTQSSTPRYVHFASLVADYGFLPDVSDEDVSHELRRAKILRFELDADDRTKFRRFASEYEEASLAFAQHARWPPAGSVPIWDENPPGAVHLLLDGDASDGTRRLRALAFEPQKPLDWEPWNRIATIMPALLFLSAGEGLVPKAGFIEIEPEEMHPKDSKRALFAGTRKTRMMRLTAQIRLEAHVPPLLATFREIDDALDRGAGRAVDQKELSSALVQLKTVRRVLLNFQDRSLFPLERFVGLENEITSKDDVIRKVLQGTI